MKAQTFYSLGNATKFILLTILLIIVGCNDKNTSRVAGAETKVKAPEIDIHTAVVTGNEEALRQHIRAGSNLNERDPFGGSSPLISAAVFGQPAMARILLESGVDVNFQNNDGSTALHTAAFFCRPEIVQMLLDNGADKSVKNGYGATPYEMVAGPFSEARNGYDVMGKMLGPMGLKLDYSYIEKTRPEIAGMLK